MASAKDIAPADLHVLGRYRVRLVRMPFRVEAMGDLKPFVDAAHAEGMTIGINLFNVSRLPAAEVARAAERVTADGADLIYIADSFGSLFPHQVSRLARSLRQATDLPLGFHAQDSIGLAFANCLVAIQQGFTYIDGTLSGVGTDGGNLAIELIVGYLRSRGRPDLSLAPLVNAGAELLTPWPGLTIKSRWAYMANGILESRRHDPASWAAQSPEDILAQFDGHTPTTS